MNPNGEVPLTSDDSPVRSEQVFRRAFFVMCICFGLNHAAVTTPVGYATSLLGSDVGNASNATLYGICMVSSLFCGPLFTSALGPKNALVLGMVLYVVYVFCFAVATNFTEVTADGIEAQTGAWVLGVGGAVIGGVGAGSLWTGQGAFFGAICDQISTATGTPLQSVTAQLSAIFAMWYLGQECFWKALFTVLSKYANAGNLVLFGVYGVLALIATAVMFMAEDARPKTAAAKKPFCASASAAFALWSDPKIWLLSGSNITFGFSAAYVGGYVNAHWLAKALNADFIGFLGAVICFIATTSSKAYAVAAEGMGTKLPIVLLGSVCFFCIAMLSFATFPDGEGPGGWGWGIMIFYILQGLGRGVYESTNKGIFADFFPGEKSVGAFANCMMQNTASATIGFSMGLAGVANQEVWLLIIGSLLTVPGIYLATMMKQKEATVES